MNNLSREKQIDIIAALCEGMSIRAVERLTGVHRDTIMRLGARVGRGCAELHDRMMVGLRVPRIECDEFWAFVGCKQKNVTRKNLPVKGDQYTFVALAASTKAILAYRTGKRDGENTDLFIRDLRERVLGTPEISTDGFHPYRPAIRDAFGERVAHGVINKTYSRNGSTQRRRAPLFASCRSSRKPRGSNRRARPKFRPATPNAATLSLRMASRRFTRLTNGFSKKLENHAAAVSLYVAHYNLCRCARNDPQHTSGWPLALPIMLGRLASFWTPLWRSRRRPDRNGTGPTPTIPGNSGRKALICDRKMH